MRPRLFALIAFILSLTVLLSPTAALGQTATTSTTTTASSTMAMPGMAGPPGSLQDASTCYLPGPAAFCDTFNTGPATNTHRSGALDETRWSVSHATGLSSLGQGQANEYIPSTYMDCTDPKTGLLPPSDYFMCAAMMAGSPRESMHMMEAFNDGGNYDYDSAMIRQPFDFAGRTGTVAFDVDAKTDGGHMWWPELWITDQPMPAPHVNTSPNLPRNGVGIEFLDNGPSGTPISLDATGTGFGNVGAVDVVTNYVDTFRDPGRGVNLNGFYTTQPDMRNRFQVRLSQDDLQVWATDADGTNFREVADVPGINLNFSRGYVAVQHADYNPGKYGVTGQQTYHWDNIGFDGPVLPLDRGYSVPDALTPGHDAGALNLAYILDSRGIETCCTNPGPASFPLTGVTLAGAVEADLTLDVWDTTGGATLTYVFNGAAPVSVPYPPPIDPKWGVPLGLVLQVPLSDLQDGTNTLALTASEPLEAANIDLVLRMSAASDAGTAATATATSSTASTGSSAFTSTTAETASTNASAVTTSSTQAVSSPGTTAAASSSVTSAAAVTSATASTFTLICTEQASDPTTILCRAAP